MLFRDIFLLSNLVRLFTFRNQQANTYVGENISWNYFHAPIEW